MSDFVGCIVTLMLGVAVGGLMACAVTTRPAFMPERQLRRAIDDAWRALMQIELVLGAVLAIACWARSRGQL